MSNRFSVSFLHRVIAALAVLLLLCNIAYADDIFFADGVPESFNEALEYYSHARIGVQTGSTTESVAIDNFPEAEICYYLTVTDLKTALSSGKIDAFLLEDVPAKVMQTEDPSFTYYDDYLSYDEIAFIFNKANTVLCGQCNEFLTKAKETGLLDSLAEKWFFGSGSAKMEIDIPSLSAENGTLRVASEVSYTPYEFYTDDGSIGGFEIELIANFAKEYGYGLNIVNMVFASVISDVYAGKSDIGVSAFTITEERKDSVLFSEPTTANGIVLCVPAKTSASSEKTGFLKSIVASFKKSFLTAERWKLFLKGMETTLLITLLSVLCGTVTGFLCFSLCRKGNRIACKLTNIATRLLNGIPKLVFLMLMYYVVFGSTHLSGLLISIIAFTIVFAFDLTALLRNESGLIDVGQLEAAYMLGYSDRKAFWKIIFPQLVNLSLPGYISAMISLLHGTAVVGYIAVEDITKVSDIIRGRTYEAFFPLIMTAVAYFLMAWLFEVLLKILKRRLDPDTRKIKLGGGKGND